jgi:hypothetical protein
MVLGWRLMYVVHIRYMRQVLYPRRGYCTVCMRIGRVMPSRHSGAHHTRLLSMNSYVASSSYHISCTMLVPSSFLMGKLLPTIKNEDYLQCWLSHHSQCIAEVCPNGEVARTLDKFGMFGRAYTDMFKGISCQTSQPFHICTSLCRRIL